MKRPRLMATWARSFFVSNTGEAVWLSGYRAAEEA